MLKVKNLIAFFWDCSGFNSDGYTNELILDTWNERIYLSGADTHLIAVSIANPLEPELIAVFGEPRDDLGAWGLNGHNNKLYGGYIGTLLPFWETWARVKAFALA